MFSAMLITLVSSLSTVLHPSSSPSPNTSPNSQTTAPPGKPLNIFFILITLFYFILLYFILPSFFLSFFPPFYTELCEGQALGAPARHQGCASEVGEPSSGHWSTRDLSAPHNIKWQKSPRDLHLNAKTQLHSTTSKLQCWKPYAKQLARQKGNPIH